MITSSVSTYPLKIPRIRNEPKIIEQELIERLETLRTDQFFLVGKPTKKTQIAKNINKEQLDISTSSYLSLE